LEVGLGMGLELGLGPGGRVGGWNWGRGLGVGLGVGVACGVVSKKRANSQPPAASSFSCTMTMGKPLASAQRTW
jgi:hypothetical protein